MSADPDNIVDLHNLQADQPVYTSDGKYLGEVAGVTIDLETGEPFLEVTASVLPASLGGKRYFIPKRAIAYAVIGQPVRLTVSSEEAEEHFTVKPTAI